MKLVVLHTDYGSQRYFHYYIMDNGKCLDAKWSKQFTTNDRLTQSNLRSSESES